MIKYIIGLISAGVMWVLGFMVLIPLEHWYLENQLNVSPLTGIRQDVWLRHFTDNAFWQLLTALLFTVVWHSIGYFYFRIDRWNRAGGRLVWLALFVIMLLAIAVIGFLGTQETQDIGKLVAVVAYLFNAICVYYISSLLASPTTVKYAPAGSVQVGRLWS